MPIEPILLLLPPPPPPPLPLHSMCKRPTTENIRKFVDNKQKQSSARPVKHFAKKRIKKAT